MQRISFVKSALFPLFQVFYSTTIPLCNDLMEFVLKIARQNNVPFHPYLLALASSADTGSSTTPIGNPRNLVIVIQSGISAGQFLLGLVPALLVGIVVTALILLCMYWKVLSVEKVE